MARTSLVAALPEPDYWRQLDVFSPQKFTTPITLIGGGAVGSYVALLLAKMGCNDITVYDFDKVETHNLPNQVFGPSDVGEKKVDALQKFIHHTSGITIKPFPKKFTKGELKGIVFVMVDTMAARKQIWESSVRYQLGVDLLVETRMGVDGGILYAVRPSFPSHVREYEETLYSDKEVQPNPCTRRAIAPAVAVLGGVAVFTMIDHVNNTEYPNELIISLAPPSMISRQF